MSLDLIDELRQLDLPEGHWALFGSGPLLLRGWIQRVNDLDVITRGPAWDHARTLGRQVPLADGNSIVEVGDGITVGSSWAFGDFNIDSLIETAEMIEAIPCVRLEHIIEYKRIADRPRDRQHLAVIEDHS